MTIVEQLAQRFARIRARDPVVPSNWLERVAARPRSPLRETASAVLGGTLADLLAALQEKVIDEKPKEARVEAKAEIRPSAEIPRPIAPSGGGTLADLFKNSAAETERGPFKEEGRAATGSTIAEFLKATDPVDAEGVMILLKTRGVNLFQRDGRLFVDKPELFSGEEDLAMLRAHRAGLLALAAPLAGNPTILLKAPPRPPQGGSLAQFLGTVPPDAAPDWRPKPPPSLAGIDSIVLNFETNGLEWWNGHRPIGVTVGTLDGQLNQFLPFGFRGDGNLDESVVKEWFRREVVGKHITNANTKFDVHMAREWGCDLEAQGNTVSDVQHYAALLDDHRKRFAIDVLAKDFLDGIEIPRVDETRMTDYEAYQVASRAEYQTRLVTELRNVMWPQLDAQELQQVRQLEDEVIYPLCEMEKNGSPIDMELLDKFHKECHSRHDNLMHEIVKEVGFAFDHSRKSWQLLFERYGIDVSYMDDKATELKPTFAEGVISTIQHPVIQKAHRAGQYASMNSKIFDAYKRLIGSDGILRYSINQLREEKKGSGGSVGGTVSGRFSIGYIQQVPNHDNHHAAFGVDQSEDGIKNCGGLCDLFPRQLYVPASGDYLEADAAQIEYRLFAHFAENPTVLQAYKDDPWLSFHRQSWGMMKQYKPDMLYSHQKNFNFAKQYGAKSVKLGMMMGFITDKEGQWIRDNKAWNDPRLKTIHEIERAYKQMMPEGDALLDKAAHLAKSECDEYCRRGDALHRKYKHRGYVKTILGRRSRFPNNWKTYIGLNRVLQGSGAEVVKKKAVELHRERKHTGLLMRMTIHDAFTGDAQMPETKQRVSELLNQQSFPALKIPILWNVGTGKTWAAAK